MKTIFKDLHEAITSRDELSIMLLQTRIDDMLDDVMACINYNPTMGDIDYDNFLEYITE